MVIQLSLDEARRTREAAAAVRTELLELAQCLGVELTFATRTQ